MDDPSDRLNDALAALRLLRHPLEFVHSERTRERLRRGLDSVESEVRAALADWQDARPGPDELEDPMKRRDLLRTGAILTTAAIAPFNALGSSSGLGFPAKVDAGLLDALAATQTAMARGWAVSRPLDLLGVVKPHVDGMVKLLDSAALPAARQRLGSLIADGAGFAGWLATDAGHMGEADAYFALAQRSAQQAGDQRLYALAVGSAGLLHSTLWTGGLGGDTALVRWQLRQALGGVGDEPTARSWLLVCAAKESAVAGDDYGLGEHLEQAARLDTGTGESEGFFSLQGYFQRAPSSEWTEWIADRGRALLGRADADGQLRARVAEAPTSRDHVDALMDLATYSATTGAVDEAAAMSLDALYAIEATGLARKLDRVWGIRASLPDGPVTAELDEALLSV